MNVMNIYPPHKLGYENTTGTRQSNIELLRIVAMVMILILHTRYDGILSVYDGVIDASHICRFFFEAASIVGVNLFVFISGFFGIRLRKVSVANLLFKVYWFAVIGFIAECIIAGSIHMGSQQYMKLFFAVSHNVWFVPCYFILMLLSPMLNAFVERKPARLLAVYTLGLYLIAYLWNIIFQCIQGFDGYGWGYFIVLYLTGAVIRKWVAEHKVNKSLCLTGYVMCTLSIVGVALLQNYVPVGQSLLWAYNSPLVLCSSVCLFLFFTSLHINPSHIINKLAASSFAVLLFHMSSFAGYFKVCKYVYTRYDDFMVIIVTALVVLGYYLAAFLLDQPGKLMFSRIKAKLV